MVSTCISVIISELSIFYYGGSTMGMERPHWAVLMARGGGTGTWPRLMAASRGQREVLGALPKHSRQTRLTETRALSVWGGV